ncbi:MAG: hypothetical protein M3041_16280 [Acidobacteriota bacterium]|nr:hypothetical protein [Acidobacteriota bacterium]
MIFAACSVIPKESVAPVQGRLELEVEPNPIVATPLGGNWYELHFDIIMRETGGVDVRIEDFTVDALALKAIPVRSQTFPAKFITDRGYPSAIRAGKYLRFGFTRRWPLPTELLLTGAAARITARTIDANGARGETTIRVGVRVGT